MNKKKITDSLNILLQNIVEIDDIENPCRGSYFITTLRISINHNKYIRLALPSDYYGVFNELLSEIYKSKDFASTISRRTFSQKLQSFLFESKKLACLDGNMVYCNLITMFNEMELKDIVVFHKVFGMTLGGSEFAKIGDFTFYDMSHESVRNHIIHTYTDNSKYYEDNIQMLEGHDIWVSTVIKSRDSEKAREVAYEKFESLQNVIRFLISFENDYPSWSKYDVGIFNLMEHNFSESVILGDGRPWEKHDTHIKYKPIDFYLLNLDSLFPKGVSFVGIIAILCKDTKSKMEERLLSAINFYGRASYNQIRSISIIESMMAIEALLNGQYDEFLTQGIAAQISEGCAFILGENQESRIEIAKFVKKLYKLRSKAAHGSDSRAFSKDSLIALDYTRELIVRFLVDEELCQLKNYKDLEKYIAKKKYQ